VEKTLLTKQDNTAQNPLLQKTGLCIFQIRKPMIIAWRVDACTGSLETDRLPISTP
jgi:hypothetical protein